MLWFNIGAEGSTNDAEVFRTSDFKRMLDEGEITFPTVSQNDALQAPYHIVGDMGFSHSKTMFTVSYSEYKDCKLVSLLFQAFSHISQNQPIVTIL